MAAPDRPVRRLDHHTLALYEYIWLGFTQFFISGWMLYLPVRDLSARINLRFAWFTYLLMTAGLLTAAVPLLTNNATVLYTFYPPLEGSPLFYIGAGVMVGSSLLVAGQVVHMW